MLKIVKGAKYDTTTATKILEANGATGKRTLLKTRNGQFFILQKDFEQYKILPCTKAEGVEFIEIHSKDLPEKQIRDILKTHFQIKPEPGNIVPFGSVEVYADWLRNALYYNSTSGKFYLHPATDDPKHLTQSEAMHWIEENQDSIPQEKLKKILKLYFPTIKEA